MAARSERDNRAFLKAELAGTRFATADWIAETGSTNDDLAERVRRGGPEQVLITDLQTAGRGRRGRVWKAPAGSGILMSVLIRGMSPADAFWAVGAVSLAAGQAIDELTTTPCRLKWPNDVMLGTGQGPKKAAGVLSAIVDDAVIVGIGINANWPDQVPAEMEQNGTAVSRHLPGSNFCDRAPLAVAIVRRAIGHLESDRAALRLAWKANCLTIGQHVRLELQDRSIVGIATDIDATGALQIEEDGVSSWHHVGDVVHLRPTS